METYDQTLLTGAPAYAPAEAPFLQHAPAPPPAPPPAPSPEPRPPGGRRGRRALVVIGVVVLVAGAVVGASLLADDSATVADLEADVRSLEQDVRQLEDDVVDGQVAAEELASSLELCSDAADSAQSLVDGASDASRAWEDLIYSEIGSPDEAEAWARFDSAIRRLSGAVGRTEAGVERCLTTSD